MSEAVWNTRARITYGGVDVCDHFDWNLRTMSGPLHVRLFCRYPRSRSLGGPQSRSE